MKSVFHDRCHHGSSPWEGFLGALESMYLEVVFTGASERRSSCPITKHPRELWCPCADGVDEECKRMQLGLEDTHLGKTVAVESLVPHISNYGALACTSARGKGGYSAFPGLLSNGLSIPCGVCRAYVCMQATGQFLSRPSAVGTRIDSSCQGPYPSTCVISPQSLIFADSPCTSIRSLSLILNVPCSDG